MTVWCVQHAKTMPTWQNIFTIIKDIECLIGFLFIYYAIVIVIYFWSYFEELKFYDVYKIMLKTLQVILNQAVAYEPSRYHRKSFLAIGLICAMIMYTHFISFYMVVIKLSIDKYQVQSRDDLIRYNFQLAGDTKTRNVLIDTKMVH